MNNKDAVPWGGFLFVDKTKTDTRPRLTPEIPLWLRLA